MVRWIRRLRNGVRNDKSRVRNDIRLDNQAEAATLLRMTRVVSAMTATAMADNTLIIKLMTLEEPTVKANTYTRRSV